MEKRIAPRSPRALTAIAAVLALATTPAFAQDASTTVQPAPTVPMQTVPTAPAVPTATAPAVAPSTAGPSTAATPTIVLPQVDNAAPATTSATPAPVAAPVAPTEEAPVATAKPQAAERAPRATPPAPAHVPTTETAGTARDGALARGDAPPAVVSSPAANAPTAPTTAPSPAAPPAPAAAPANTDNDAGFPVEGVIGLLAALGIAGAGAHAMTRRRRVDSDDEFVDDFAAAEPEPTPAAMADPMALPANPPARLGPSAEALAAGPVPIGDDRTELLEAMVAAAPNEANPFTSRKARMRRARLILQHREHLQMQGKPFDWRTYRPTTRPSNPTPTETLVEA